MIRGKKINLCAVEKEHLPILQKWRNNPEFRKYYREYRELSLEHKQKWYDSKIINDDSWQFFVVKPQEKDIVIGSCGLTYINWIHRTGEFSITIGDENYRSGGYGSDTLRTLIKYGFEDLNLNRIWCEVYSNNAAVDIYRHIGFRDEGTLRQSYYNEGKYWDSYILSMLKEEYEQKYRDKD